VWFVAVSEGEHRRRLRRLLQLAARDSIVETSRVATADLVNTRTTSHHQPHWYLGGSWVWLHRPPPRLWSVSTGQGPRGDDTASRPRHSGRRFWTAPK